MTAAAAVAYELARERGFPRVLLTRKCGVPPKPGQPDWRTHDWVGPGVTGWFGMCEKFGDDEHLMADAVAALAAWPKQRTFAPQAVAQARRAA